jgi:hypothetical protein
MDVTRKRTVFGSLASASDNLVLRFDEYSLIILSLHKVLKLRNALSILGSGGVFQGVYPSVNPLEHTVTEEERLREDIRE